MDRLTTIKAAASAAAAALTAFWGWTGWLAAAWFLAMVLDYATGSAAALHAGTSNSARCPPSPMPGAPLRAAMSRSTT